MDWIPVTDRLPPFGKKVLACSWMSVTYFVAYVAVGRVAPILPGHAHTEHHALDAPAGVAAGERGGLTWPCYSTPPAPTGGKIAREVKSEDREIEEAEAPPEEEQQLGPLVFHLRPIQRTLYRR